MFYHIINKCVLRSSYRINHFKIHIKFLCQISIKEKQTLQQKSPTIKNKDVTESKYPEYEIIYRFPYMKYISLFHKSKRNMLITSGLMIPVMFFLSQGNIISEIPATFTSIIGKPYYNKK